MLRPVIAGAVLVASLTAVGCSGGKEPDKYKDPGIKMYERPAPGIGGGPPKNAPGAAPKGVQ
jgi:hypothetical protein